MKKNMLLIALVVLVYVNTIPVFASNGDDVIIYTNSKGVGLTEKQYNIAIKYLTEEELDLYTQEECDALINSKGKSVVSEQTIYVKTQIIKAQNGMKIINEELISEDEMNKEIELEKSRMISPKSIMLNSLADRDYVVNTNYKRITMHMDVSSLTSKTVSLNCTWKKIPSIKSYDVIGFRPLGVSLSNNYYVEGSQKYDGKTIYYDYGNQKDHFKVTSGGVGLSSNISNDVKSSLSLTLKANFITGQEPFTVYGSYQHATSNVTLSQSKDYSFSSAGMGYVFDFSRSVSKKYDNTPGLMVKGSLYDYF